jgi:hypothetical protein
MALITKLTKKIEFFFVDKRVLESLELLKQKYVEALILIPLNWDTKFHVHTYASLLAMGALLAQNIVRNRD